MVARPLDGLVKGRLMEQSVLLASRQDYGVIDYQPHVPLSFDDA